MNYGPNMMDIYPRKKVDIFPNELFPPQAFFYDKYNPNRNALVFSGTNSGKTFYARHAINGGLLEGKRCVILAPSKQLIYQKQQEFIQMSGYGVGIVGMATGERRSKEDKPLMVTSPEKFISALRNKEQWATDVKIMIVDEIHNIIRPPINGVDRGEMLDVAITLGINGGAKILGLSGSVPDHHKDKLVKWMDADLFESNFSPSVIDKKFIITSDKATDLKKIVEQHKDEFILVFAPTKNMTEEAAKLIGSPFCHAGLTPDVKKRVIKRFEKGVDKTLVSTSMLAEGINGPTDVVVIYGLKRTPSQFVDCLDVQQMSARGARYPKVTGNAYILGDINEIFWAKKGVNERARSIATVNITLTLLSMSGEVDIGKIKSVAGSSYGATFFKETEKVVVINGDIDDMVETGIVKGADAFSLTIEGAVLSHYFLSPMQYAEYLNFASIFTGKIREMEEIIGEDDGYEVVSDDKGGIKEIELFSILMAILLETYSKPQQKSYLNRLQFKLIQNNIISPPSSISTAASILEAFIKGKGVGMKSVSYALYSNMSRWLSALDEIERAGKKVPFLSSVKVWVKRLRAVLYVKKKVKKGNTTGQVVLNDNTEKGVTADEFISKIETASTKLLPAFKNSFESLSFSDEDKIRIKEAINVRELKLKVVSIAA